MRAFLMAIVMCFAAPTAAQEVRTLGDQESPPATLDQISWLIGSWAGTGLGGESHESWLPAVAGQMAGVFHQTRNGEMQFYEILQFVPRDGSLVLRLKHFNGDLSGWEDNTAESALEFPLVAIEGNTAYFSGLTYQLTDEGALNIHLRLRQGEETSIVSFEMTRIE